MFRIIAPLTALVLLGCGREEPPAPQPEPLPPVRLAVSHDVGLLVERWTRALADDLPVDLSVDITAAGLAYTAVLDGTAHAALVHRRANPAEQRRAAGDDLIAGEGLSYRELGSTPVTLVVHDENPVEVVSVAQAAGLLSGVVESWGEVGGTAVGVERFVRERNTATWQVLDTWLGPTSPAPGQSLPDAAAVGTAVRATPGGLGTGGGTTAPGTRFLGLRLEGGELVMPLSGTVSGAGWPLERPLLLVTRGRPSPAVEAWVARISTPEGRALAEQNGYILTAEAP